ncbi:MAG: hypothetical protein OEO83_10860 [Alphaproteobacteria bacterium]|nr:hypothetical protein [Alphaproteobacteria bacterium]
MITRTIGILLVLAALIAAGVEIYDWRTTGTYKPLSTGEIWYKTHRASLNGAQAATQRYLAPWLWDPPMVWLLRQPAWAVAGVPGILLLLIGLSRRKKRRKGAVRFPHDD